MSCASIGQKCPERASHRGRRQTGDGQGLGDGVGSECSRVRVSLGVTRMFWNWTEVVVAQHGECAECHQTGRLRRADFVFCDFRLNKNTSLTFKNKRPGWHGGPRGRKVCSSSIHSASFKNIRARVSPALAGSQQLLPPALGMSPQASDLGPLWPMLWPCLCPPEPQEGGGGAPAADDQGLHIPHSLASPQLLARGWGTRGGQASRPAGAEAGRVSGLWWGWGWSGVARLHGVSRLCVHRSCGLCPQVCP